VRGVLIYCSNCKCSHSIAISGDQWADDVRLPDIEPQFVWKACACRSLLSDLAETRSKFLAPIRRLAIGTLACVRGHPQMRA
jgi:hypothetical protein